jgi:hypothetical protein
MLNRKMLTIFFTLALACMMLTRAGAQQATVSVAPPASTVPNVGMSFSVNVTVEGVENLYAWALNLYYPNAVLNGTSVAEGAFLKAGYPTAFLVINFTDTYNATDGFLSVLCTRTGDVPGVNGSGTLLTVTFKSTSTGAAENLHLDNVKLSDSNSTAISFAAADGEVTVLPEFPPALVPLLLMASTLIAVALRRKMSNHRGMFQSV